MPIAEVVESLIPDPELVRVDAFDGSSAGPPSAPVEVRILRPEALVRVITRPGELGLARAYVAGDVELGGDIEALFSLQAPPRPSLRMALQLFSSLRGAGGHLFRVPAPPSVEARPTGRLHSRRRDASSVRFHYDISNEFYELLLGPSMVYSCAVFASDDESLATAQLRKVDLICKKLGLTASSRLLDVGCGWGTLAIHAARTYGCRVVGVTLSEPQRAYAEARAREVGVDGLVTFRIQDYRDVDDGPYDAISSVGMAEHVGRKALGTYVDQMHSLLAPGGRLLHHAIGRPAFTEEQRARRHRNGSAIRSPFIARYVFPDGELHEVGSVLSLLQERGLEVRHLESLREHYARTLRCWSRNLEEHFEEAVALVGPERARVWRLYIAASAAGFEHHRLEVHQTLCVRPLHGGQSTMPLRPSFDATVNTEWLASLGPREESAIRERGSLTELREHSTTTTT